MSACVVGSKCTPVVELHAFVDGTQTRGPGVENRAKVGFATVVLGCLVAARGRASPPPLPPPAPARCAHLPHSHGLVQSSRTALDTALDNFCVLGGPESTVVKHASEAVRFTPTLKHLFRAFLKDHLPKGSTIHFKDDMQVCVWGGGVGGGGGGWVGGWVGGCPCALVPPTHPPPRCALAE